MPYDTALAKSWEELGKLADKDAYTVELLGDTYELGVKERRSSSVSCNVPTKDFLTILLLHYLIGSLKGGFTPSGEWISFKDVENGEIYYPAFREGAIKPLLRKFGDNPKGILAALEKFKGKSIKEGDAGIEITTFKDMSVRIVLWKGDEEFGPEATLLFDRNIPKLFTMEDIVVFSRFVTHSL